MPDPKERREFSCMDDCPTNNGWGYNSPNPYDNYEVQEREEPDESIPDENYTCDEEE